MTATTTDAYTRFSDALRASGQKVKGAGRDRLRATCPAHGGQDLNLSVAKGDQGTLIKCWSHGCTEADIARSVGLELRDLFDQDGRAEYDYGNGHKVVRTRTNTGKAIRQENTPAITSLYSPAGGHSIESSAVVLLAEGEKTTDALIRMGAPCAATWPGGSSAVGKVDLTPLAGKTVIICPDNDAPGDKAAQALVERLTPIAGEIRFWRVPETFVGHPMNDAADLHIAGGSLDDLTEEAPEVPELTTPAGVGEQHSGQVRMAYRLAAAHGDKLMYVHGIGWHYWDGRRWTPDHAGRANRAVLDVLATALAESIGDKQLRADVARCESANGIAGVLGIASALVEFATTVEMLDADPHLLNCANGTLDLRTRRLGSHAPADRLTKVTAGAYRPDADMDVWSTFLGTVLPDADEREYLQRVMGQSVYGQVREHLFPVLIGTGANGKGTAYGAVVHALGDYAQIIDPDMLMARGGSGVGGPELMQLLGARLVVGSETEEGRKLDEATMKRLTGGDKLTARNLYQAPVSWLPSHQIVYVTNALPQVKGNDPAVWRRIRVVPFDVVIPPAERDPELNERLQLHADAILSWVVEGHWDYTDNGGMREPSSVVRATDDYRDDSDSVASFVEERCTKSRTLSATTRQLYAAWQAWQISNGAEQMTEKKFGGEMDRLGFTARRTNTGALREGIGLLGEATD